MYFILPLSDSSLKELVLCDVQVSSETSDKSVMIFFFLFQVSAQFKMTSNAFFSFMSSYNETILLL